LTVAAQNRLTGSRSKFLKEIVMQFKKAIVALAIGSAAATASAAGGPGFGPDLLGTGADEGRPGHHQRHSYRHHHGEHGPHHHGPRHGAGPMSPEQAEARIDRMAARLVRSVDGTPEQRQKVSEIAKAAAKDLQALRKQGRDLRRQGMDLLKAPTIDRAAIEALRGEQMAVADAISKRMSNAFADTAEVLTPEQRAKLGERMQSRRGARRG
jgi:Spy/CpxP family protein refolding chaperone